MCFVNLFLVACNGPADLEEQLFWHEQDGRFVTTDMERAFAKTKLPPALPSYLPEKLRAFPPYFTGPSWWASAKDEMWLLVYYGTRLDDGLIRFIEIEESVGEINFAADFDGMGEQYSYVDVSGRQVLLRNLGDENILATALYFNRDGISFQILVQGFSEEEAIKVVESMLE